MLHLERPVFDASTVYTDCVKVRRDPSRKASLNSIHSTIVDSETEYSRHASRQSLHLMLPTTHVGSIHGSELTSLYDEVLANESRDPYRFYVKLLSGANGDIDTCPACDHRTVSTLDHHLPKSAYPAYAVTPLNLVPMCKDCNHAKGEARPSIKDGFFLHPYFKGKTAPYFLKVNVIKADPPGLVYSLRCISICPPRLARDAQFHFRELGLARLYAVQASRFLCGIATKLQKAGNRGGPAAVREALIDDAESWGASAPLSWQWPLLLGLIASEWFCRDGYKLVQPKR